MLTLAQAAARLGLSPSTLRNQVAAGRLKARLVGKTWTVTDGEVARYQRESLGKVGRPVNTHNPTPDPAKTLRVRRGRTITTCEKCGLFIAETVRRGDPPRFGWRHLDY